VGVLFLALGGLGLLARGSFLLRLTAIFRPDRVMQRVTDQQVLIGRKLFLLARLAGLREDVHRYTGELPQACLIVSNHQSMADIAIIPVVLPRCQVRFVAKSELKYGIPYVSLALRLGRHAVISRTSDYRAGRRIMVKLADLAVTGVCPTVFPEGRRSRTGGVQEFQTGAFRIILERTPLPVLSVAVDGGYRIAGLRGLLANIGRTCYRAKPLTLYPAPHGKKEILDLLARIQKEIADQVGAWRRAGA